MRDVFIILAVAACFTIASNAAAEARIYNFSVKFAPSTPANIEVKAYESFEFTILGQRQELSALYLPPPLDPNIRYIQEPTQIVTAEYLNQDMVGPILAVALPPTISTLRIPGLAPGKYKIRLMYPKGEVFDEREIRVNPGAIPVVVESQGERGPNAFRLNWFASKYYVAPASEAKSTPFVGVPGGRRFGAWMVGANAPSESVPLYHLSFTLSGISGGVINFYTINADHRTALRAAGWQDNGVLVNVMRETSGLCAVGTEPVYRAFRPSKGGAWGPTHRYTNDVTAYRDWIANGNYVGEGVAFCGRVVTESIAETTTF
jgi:hypothetical protein